MQQPCLICGRKASDEFAVPLCRLPHRAAPRVGDERAWWKAAGIDPIKIARRLWKQTRVAEGRLPPDAIKQTPQPPVKAVAVAERQSLFDRVQLLEDEPSDTMIGDYIDVFSNISALAHICVHVGASGSGLMGQPT
jgi:hypothetical protein